MTLERTIQRMFNGYPGLFKTRADCLDQLFCVIGNGYHWKDGELVSGEDDALEAVSLDSFFVNGKAFQHNKLSIRAERDYYNKQFEKRHHIRSYENAPAEVRELFERIEREALAGLPDDKYYTTPRCQRWYFFTAGYCHDYAYLFNYPDDIKPDWLSGIEECKQLLREDGYDVDHPLDSNIDFSANRQLLWESRKEVTYYAE